MAFCLLASWYYLNQWWRIISGLFRSGTNFFKTYVSHKSSSPVSPCPQNTQTLILKSSIFFWDPHLFHDINPKYAVYNTQEIGVKSRNCGYLVTWFCYHNIPNCMKEVTWLRYGLCTNGHWSAALGWLPFILRPVFVQAAVIRSW